MVLRSLVPISDDDWPDDGLSGVTMNTFPVVVNVQFSLSRFFVVFLPVALNVAVALVTIAVVTVAVVTVALVTATLIADARLRSTSHNNGDGQFRP